MAERNPALPLYGEGTPERAPSWRWPWAWLLPWVSDAVRDVDLEQRVEWLEAAWRPVVPAPLDVSVPAVNVNAPAVWQVQKSLGAIAIPLTGKGVTIANFDTGVDVHHPAFLDGSDNRRYRFFSGRGKALAARPGKIVLHIHND